RALRDLASVVERDDSVGQAAEEADLVVHEAERGAPVVNLSKDGREIEDLVAPEARCRLVQEENLRVAHKGHGQAEHLFLAVGEVAGELPGGGGEVAESQHL